MTWRPFTDYVARTMSAWNSAAKARQATLLVAFCTAVFVLVNWRNYVVDDIPQSLLPVTLLREGTVQLDSYRPFYDTLKESGKHYAFTDVNGHLYARNSMYVSMLVAPLYLPPVLAGVSLHDARFWIAWGTLCAAFFTAVAVALTYLTLCRWVDGPSALMLSLLYAFGSCLWTIIAHTIYDHLGGLVCVAALAWTLDRFPLSPARAFWAAFLAGAAVGMRPCTVVLLFPLGLYLYCWPGIFATVAARCAAVIGIVLIPLSNAILNAWCFGSWYKTGYPSDLATDWGNPWWEGMTGLLIAPNSGLFTQSPIALLAVVGGWKVWMASSPSPHPASPPQGGRECVSQRGLLRAYSLCFVGYWVLFAHRNQWQGGLDFATRYLSEGYPLWMPLAAVGWSAAMRSAGGRVFVAVAGTWSVLYQLANIATFDAITELNPQHIPWEPRRHFLIVFVDKYGIWAAFTAFLGALVRLALCSIVLFYVLGRFLEAGIRDSARLVETRPKA